MKKIRLKPSLYPRWNNAFIDNGLTKVLGVSPRKKLELNIIQNSLASTLRL